jgi:hypothetical protein
LNEGYWHQLTGLSKILIPCILLLAILPWQASGQATDNFSGNSTANSVARFESGNRQFNKLQHDAYHKKQPFLSEIQSTDQLNVLIEESQTEIAIRNGKQSDKRDGQKFHFSYRQVSDYLHNVLTVTPAEEVNSLRNANRPFMKKAGRGALLIGGVEVIGMVALILMPKEVTKWEDDWIKDAERNYKRAFTEAPVMDQDDWQINYIGHPVAGSFYYNAVRSQNATWWQSLLFATAQSFIWEYIIEGCAEQPSIQDLIYTPLGGMAIGEPAHLATMAMRRNGFKFIEKVATLIINPMFVINNGFRTPFTAKPTR